MRVFWEKLGVLGPIYRLVGRGLNDRDIANKLNLTEVQVQACISWMLRSFKMNDRMELIREAFTAEHPLKGMSWAMPLGPTNKGEHMGDSLRYPQWQEALLTAVMEINPARMTERIGIAETAISSRREQLTESESSGDEKIALQEGISTLQSLKRVALTRGHGF